MDDPKILTELYGVWLGLTGLCDDIPDGKEKRNHWIFKDLTLFHAHSKRKDRFSGLIRFITNCPQEEIRHGQITVEMSGFTTLCLCVSPDEGFLLFDPQNEAVRAIQVIFLMESKVTRQVSRHFF